MLQKYVAEGVDDIDMVTRLIGDVMETGAWREFTDPLGFTHSHDSFRSFIETRRWKGLGSSKDALVAWVGQSDEAIARDIERVWKNEVPVAAKHGEVGNGRSRASVTCSTSRGNASADSILARLKRDNTELAQQVINGEITANAAARIMGWRKPRVLLTSPEPVARKITDTFTEAEIAETRGYLMPENTYEVTVGTVEETAEQLNRFLTVDELGEVLDYLAPGSVRMVTLGTVEETVSQLREQLTADEREQVKRELL